MIERPILFSDAMVRALLDSSKTQTRRIVKDLPPWPITEICSDAGGTGKWMPNGPAPGGVGMAAGHWRECPYGRPGDRLWVKEAFALSVIDPDGGDPEDEPENWDVIYRADPEQPGGGWTDGEGNAIEAPWKCDRDMPRWASRILLEVLSVRAERLQEISENDARAEGLTLSDFDPSSPVFRYACLWDDIYGRGNWNANPWVWVIEFKRLEPSCTP